MCVEALQTQFCAGGAYRIRVGKYLGGGALPTSLQAGPSWRNAPQSKHGVLQMKYTEANWDIQIQEYPKPVQQAPVFFSLFS